MGIFGPGSAEVREYHYYATIENADMTREVMIVSPSLDQAWLDAEQMYSPSFEILRVRPDYFYNSTVL